jgi:hypothetical protein
MVEIILKYQEQEIPVNVATCWGDATYSQFCELLRRDSEGTFDQRLMVRMCVFTGLEPETIRGCSAQTVNLLSNAVAFSFDYKELEECNEAPEEYATFDPGSEEWGKLELAKQAMQAMQNENELFCAGHEVVKIYTDVDITSMPITEVYGMVNFFIAKSFFSANDSQLFASMNTRTPKSKPGSKRDFRHSGFFLHFTRFVRAIRSNTKKC